MKKIILSLLFVFSFSAFGQTVAPGLVSNAIVAGSGAGRYDAQIEARNDGGQGHALIAITQMRSPGSTAEEAAISYQAYDDSNTMRQVGSISTMWSNNASVSNGFGVLRFNVDTAAGASDIFMRGFAFQGVTFFYDSETDVCGGRFICIKRTSGLPSIAGKDDLALEGKAGGTGQIILNGIGGGQIYMGGELRLAAGSMGCPASVPPGVAHCFRVIAQDGNYSYIPAYR